RRNHVQLRQALLHCQQRWPVRDRRLEIAPILVAIVLHAASDRTQQEPRDATPPGSLDRQPSRETRGHSLLRDRFRRANRRSLKRPVLLHRRAARLRLSRDPSGVPLRTADYCYAYDCWTIDEVRCTILARAQP